MPTRPQRVVVLEGRRDLEVALALGYEPIAVGPNAFWNDGGAAGFIGWKAPASVKKFEQLPTVEDVLALQPDLIIGREFEIEENASQLARIAPLVPIDSGYTPWRPELESLGKALEREAQFEKALAEYDARIADIRERHRDRISNSTLAVVSWNPQQWASSSKTGFLLASQTLADVGGRHLPYLEDGEENENGLFIFSHEETRQLAAADAILIALHETNRPLLEANVLWQQLPAVQAGRVVWADSRTYYGSVYGATECLRLIDLTYATLA